MDVVGSEIGHKMRSAIKAKLTELGCYVDDELPDYVMVMVANKRTRSQMEDDLQLFLGENTELFVNWLHQVLKKLQEVTVAPTIKPTDNVEPKERSQSKDRKTKEKKSKDKSKKSDSKKAKKKEKAKLHKKIDKKAHKSKKKSKHHEMIRPNIPPLLMNIEKDSEPSITDVFAGQILKNHGIIIDQPKEQKEVDKKPVVEEVKRPILPIIDPASIPSQSELSPVVEGNQIETPSTVPSLSTLSREQHLKEMNMIEDKMEGLKQKLAEQLEAMSEDDDDFLNIRTEADELMNDFAEDVFQEVSLAPILAPVIATPPLKPKSPSPKPQTKPTSPIDLPKDPVETLPQIELKLPKRTMRERLGTREHVKKAQEPKNLETNKRTDSPERFTPERQPESRSHSKSLKTRIEMHDKQRKTSSSDDNVDKCEISSRKLTSRVSVLEGRERGVVGGAGACASVVRVRPRPRVTQPASSLLLRAVADAHKSLLNIPPKPEPESHKVKRALVLPMRRTVEPQKIVIQVPTRSSRAHAQVETDAEMDRHADTISLGEMDSDDDKSFKGPSDTEKEEYIPAPITKKFTNTEYVPSRRNEVRTSSRKDDTLIIETINIHNPTIDKDRNTQFIVTMDGYDPNVFLTKKLQNEGLLNEDEDVNKQKETKDKSKEITKEKPQEAKDTTEVLPETTNIQKKRLSNESEESDTQVIIKKEDEQVAKPKTTEEKIKQEAQAKKRKGSPIVFDVGKKEKETERERVRTESASSDNHVTVTTTTNTHKYDAVPPLSQAERKLVWCRAFPQCRYGSTCAFAHPRCKFLAACTRRSCVYSHSPNAPLATPVVAPVIASHVVPSANYKTISSPLAVPGMCKYFPGCANPSCHYYHPKPCRYGKNCANKLECNFYHSDVPAKWRYPV